MPPGGVPDFFDAHCDTAAKVLDDKADFLSFGSAAHVSLPRMEAAGMRVQVFACCSIYPETPPEAAAERGRRLVETVHELVSISDGRLRLASTSDELRRSFVPESAIAAILSLEGADPLEGRAENLRWYVDQGVRGLIPAWADNAFGGAALGRGTGLTREGERLVGLAEELRVMLDVSHASDRAFDDLCRLSNRPFIASHSNCRSLCPHPRNLTDAMIRRIADRGGVLGINLAPHFLDPRIAERWLALFGGGQPAKGGAPRETLARWHREVPRPKLDWVLRHMLHAVNVGGEDCVGLGGDLDGIEQTPEGIDSVADYPRLLPLFREAGLSERQIEKVCFGNFLRVFSEILG
jgi:membrane dipeptidase